MKIISQIISRFGSIIVDDEFSNHSNHSNHSNYSDISEHSEILEYSAADAKIHSHPHTQLQRCVDSTWILRMKSAIKSAFNPSIMKTATVFSCKKNQLYYVSLFIYLLVGCLFFMHVAHAENSMDLFSGKDSVLLETLKGTGKKYIYLSEGLLSIATYIKSKNVMVLFGIVIVSFFFNALIQVAGVN